MAIPTIEILAKRLKETRGLEYYRAKQTLLYYIRGLPQLALLEEIFEVTDIHLLPVLLSCGLSWDAQLAVADRAKELEK